MRSNRNKNLLPGRLQASSLFTATPTPTSTSTALFNLAFSAPLYSTKKRSSAETVESDEETTERLCKSLQDATEKMRQEWLKALKAKPASVDQFDRSYGKKVWADYKKTNPWVLETPSVTTKIKTRYGLECNVLSTNEHQHIISFAKNHRVQPGQVESICDSLNDLGIKAHLHSPHRLVVEGKLTELNQALEKSINRKVEKEYDSSVSSFRPGRG